MDVIANYSNEHHRSPVMTRGETVFGYETAHNTPSLAIEKTGRERRPLFVALAGN